MSNEIIKPINYIPFSKKEIILALEELLNDRLNYLLDSFYVDSVNNKIFKIDNDFYFSLYEGCFFLFKKELEKCNKNDFIAKRNTTYSIENIFDLTPSNDPNVYEELKDYIFYPSDLNEVKLLEKIYKCEDGSNTSFIADENGNEYWLKVGGTWLKKEWGATFESYPVLLFKLKDISSFKELLFNFIKLKFKCKYLYLDGMDPEYIEIIEDFSKDLSFKDDRIYLNSENIDTDKIDKRKDLIFKKLLNNMGLDVPVTSDKLAKYLLECETNRCDLDKYPDSMIKGSDENCGLWNFWNSEEDSEYGYTINISEPIYTRNPCADIKRDCAIGIDFGTSSTVVVRTNGTPHPVLMSIGKDDKYENPTIMQPRNLTNFMKAYRSKESRPNTSWNDLWVSHAVKNLFDRNNISVEKISSVFSELKQWAADDLVNTVIKPINEKYSFTLKTLQEILEDKNEFNPIEIYAYYIGLYINNRLANHGIYLNYYMSFPAKYDKDTRERIRESFERGIRKSIPQEVFKDSNNKLKVVMTVTEPEAYAAFALRYLGFMPKKDEAINYAIYDFGGGTTDFAFGRYKRASGVDNRFELQNLAVDGDRFLGAENILAGLAFEVFADNLEILEKEGCCFCYGLPDQDTSRVPDKFLSEQQTAKRNMRFLIEKLRDYWENQIIYFNFDSKLADTEAESQNKGINRNKDLEGLIDEIKKRSATVTPKKITQFNNLALKTKELINDFPSTDEDTDTPDKVTLEVTLTPENIKEGENRLGDVKVDLTYSKTKIYQYFENRVKKGVNSFFSRLIDVFHSGSNSDVKVNVLLAGNASKAPILGKLLNEKIKEINKSNPKLNIRLFSQLGTDNSYEEIKQLIKEQHPEKLNSSRLEMKIDMLRNDPNPPTGKTGVALGLIELASQQYVKIDRELVKEDEFIYYIGDASVDEYGLDVFIPFDLENASTRGKPEIGTCYPIFDEIEDKNIYNIFVTNDPECLSEEHILINNTKIKPIKISMAKKGKKIFIRAKSARELEWVEAKSLDEAINEMDKRSSDIKIRHTIRLD